MPDVSVIGVGEMPSRVVTSELSYRELMYRCAGKAYADAGIEHTDVDAFVTSAEDFLEGTSIFDEYVPDQLGAVLKPVFTTAADGLYALINAWMLIRTGIADIVLVEAHSKVSELLNLDVVERLAQDPNWIRPLGFSPHFPAGLEAMRYLHDEDLDPEVLSLVSCKNRNNALANDTAAFGARLSLDDALASPLVADPLREVDIATPSDYGCVMILASEAVAKDYERAVPLQGLGYNSGTPNLSLRDYRTCMPAAAAAADAYAMAGVRSDDVDFAEVDDLYAHRELVHLEALGLSPDPAGELVAGEFELEGPLPINASGGALGLGRVFEAQGLARAAELVKQMRGEAGGRQLEGTLGLAHAWRGPPTESHAVILFGDAEVES